MKPIPLDDRAPPGLAVDALLDQARREAGLDDFGDDSFREALGVLLRSALEEARLHEDGRARLGRSCVHSLIARLHAQDHLKRNPGILDIEVRRPLFVLGLPRTGSTMTQALLSQDPASRAPAFWEMHRPARAPGEVDDGPRRLAARRWVADYYRYAPEEKAAHAMDAEAPDECLRLLQHNFTTLVFATRYAVETYPRWLLDTDLRPAYRYYRQLLQILLHARGGAPLVLKDPFHTWHLDALLAVFPDACVVQLHRDLRQVVPSWLRLCALAQGGSSDRVDPGRVRDQWLPLLERGLERLAAARAAAPPGAILDVAYDDLVRDPVCAIRGIYTHFGLELSEEAERRMRAWVAENPRHKHGVHCYSLEACGLDAAALDRLARAGGEP